MNKKYFYLAVIVAVLARLALIPNPGFEADISFWKSWGLATWDQGILWGMHNTNNNYPTPFAYVLGIMVALYSRFADPHIFNEFWRNTNILFLAVSKLFPIAADFGIAALILFIGKHAKKLGFPSPSIPLYPILAAAYLLSPIGLIDGAWWGQVDSLGVLLFLIAFIFAISKKSFLAGLVFMVAMMTKLQNMIYGPLLFLFIWQETGLTGLLRATAGATLAFLGLNIEFFLARDMGRVIQSLTENFDYFPYMSLNAFNLWWIVAGGHGMQIIDKVAAVGIANAKTVGLMLFSAFYLFASVRQFVVKNKQGFIESLVIVNGAFFIFMTQSHDRYAFPLSVFLLLWAPFFLVSGVKYQVSRLKLFFVFYGLFTLLYFYNLHTALVLNYPNNGLPILSLLTQPVFTIATSYLQLGLFGVFVYLLLRASKPSRWLLLIALGMVVVGILAVNKPLLTHQPVYLSDLTPFDSHQDYGGRQEDRAVNSSFGTDKLTRLSVQYVFYDHGIGTHANSRHVYDINKKFKRFTFDYGIDTEAGADGSAVFEVWADGTVLFRSEPIKRFDLPKHAEVDVTGVKNLKLVTTDAGDGINSDHTDWLNPQLWP
jgi:Gpi18-like mannosyltransferase